jgi:hypothetical protein
MQANGVPGISTRFYEVNVDTVAVVKTKTVRGFCNSKILISRKYRILARSNQINRNTAVILNTNSILVLSPNVNLISRKLEDFAAPFKSTATPRPFSRQAPDLYSAINGRLSRSRRVNVLHECPPDSKPLGDSERLGEPKPLRESEAFRHSNRFANPDGGNKPDSQGENSHGERESISFRDSDTVRSSKQFENSESGANSKPLGDFEAVAGLRGSRSIGDSDGHRDSRESDREGSWIRPYEPDLCRSLIPHIFGYRSRLIQGVIRFGSGTD